MEITDKHESYEANAIKWQFLSRSFLGGDDYRDGQYLLQYILEDKDEYAKRLSMTPIDNHCKNVISIYSSFLWRLPPTRNFGSLAKDQGLVDFLKDADLDGRGLNQFMSDAQMWSGVYGHVWVIMDKPAVVAQTKADELQQKIRPYVTLITPDNVLDWEYTRSANGRYEISMLKVVEDVTGDKSLIRVWEADKIKSYEVEGEDAKLLSTIVNPLGVVPAVCLYGNRSNVRGIGQSDISDVAYMQRAIYNELSEIEQLIRISNHPSLVKSETTTANSGAGSVIDVAEHEEFKPYLLQPSGGNLDAIRASITDKVEAINRMTHMGAVRATDAQTKSGVALQTEFQLLNAKLAEKADLLELAEVGLWDLFCAWQGIPPQTTEQITIDYPDSFDLRDASSDLEFLQKARASGVPSQRFNKGVDKLIAELVLDDLDLAEAYKEIDAGGDMDQGFEKGQIYKYHIDGGVVTQNEARNDLGLTPMAGGDVVAKPQTVAAE